MNIGPSQQRSSSFTSRVVVTGTTITYAILYWHQYSVGAIIGFTILTYVLTSLSRMHLGFNYPSDCILSLPVILLIIGASHGLHLLESSAFGC